MNIIVERLPDCLVTLQVEIPAEIVAQERAKITSYYAQQAKIPGYRPGKAPARVIEKRYQKQIDEELRSQLVRRGCQEGIKKEDLDVLHVSEVKDEEFHLDDTFTFTAHLAVAPEFELPDYKEIPIEVKKVDVTDHDVDHALHHLRQRMADFQDIEGRPLEKGDFAVVTYSATLDGTPLEEAVENVGYLAKGEEQWLRMDEDAFLPGFSDAMMGMNIGDTKEFELTMDDEFPVEDLRGKVLAYKTELKGIKAQTLPELTDELVGSLQEGLTVEGLKEEQRKDLERQQKDEQREEMTTQILEYLDKNVTLELPKDVVENETQRQVHEIVRRSQMQGVSDDKLKEEQDAIFQHAATQAEVNVKTGFILQKIAEKEEIKAEEQEMLGYIAQMAQSEKTPMEKYIKQLQKNDQISTIQNRIVTSKTLDFLRENASVTEVDRPPHECDLDH